jgi:predicted short-subunit dehydrogenase-like oxidoreductase (DUF2520 family)
VKLNISFIGAGNLASRLALEFDRQGHTVYQVIATSEESSYELAKRFGAYFADSLEKFKSGSELVVIAVPDDQIAAVAKSLRPTDALLVHCSGSTDMDVLHQHKHYGVFYPLQTFSKDRDPDWLSIPILTEASDLHHLKVLNELADGISNKVIEASSKERQRLHLSAVWANNFSNYMYRMAEKCLEGSRLNFELLHSLIAETTKKAIELGPQKAQTGPALRGDEQTMLKHLEMMDDPRSIELYRIISEAINASEKE